MRVGRVDLRGVSVRQRRGRIAAFLSSGGDFGLLIGHGDDSGARFCGILAKDVREVGGLAHLLFHACNCGRLFVPELARTGLATYGFVTNVLLSTDSGVEFDTCLQVLRKFPREARAKEVKAELQEAWGELALEFLTKRHDIVMAAVLSHLRLSLRAFEPLEPS